MPNTTKSAIDVQRDYQVFGTTTERVLDSFDLAHGDDKMKLLGRLSDVQEMIERGDTETARKTVNQIKLLLMERMYR